MRGRGPGRPPISPQRMMGPRGMMAGRFRNPGAPSRGRPSMMQNGMGIRGGSPMMSRGVAMRPRGMVSPRGGNFQGNASSFPGPSPLKRIAPMPRMPSLSTRPLGQGPPPKRMRMPGPYNMGMGGGMGPGQGNYNTAVDGSSDIEITDSSSSATPPIRRAVNPATLDAVGRLCRICASPNAVIFRLKDKLELVERVQSVLNLNIDLEEDEKKSYPGVVCRKGCNLVETFFHYKKSVSDGQTSLETQVEEHLKSKEAERLAAEAAAAVETVLSPSSPDCIGVDPLDSILPDNGDDNIQIMDEDSNASVLPDLPEDREATPHIQVGGIRIKQELGGKLGRKMMTSISATAFADIKVKMEPGETNCKDKRAEKKEEGEKVPGELFNQLLGEVNKLNDKEGEKKNEEEEKDSGDKSDDDDQSKLSSLPSGISISSTVSLKNTEEGEGESEGKDKSEKKAKSDSSANTQETAYNHSDYADLVGPWSGGAANAPLAGLMDPWIPDENSQEDLENAPGLEVRVKESEGGNEDDLEYYDDNGDQEPEKTAPEATKSGNDPLIEAKKDGENGKKSDSKEVEKSKDGVEANKDKEEKGTEDNNDEDHENVDNAKEVGDDECVENEEQEGNENAENENADDHEMEDGGKDLEDGDNKDGDLDDDFGGYDPLQLVQITTESGDVNDLDFEMEEEDPDMMTDSIDEQDYDPEGINNMEDEGEEDSMNTDNDLSMDTPDQDGIKTNEDINNDSSDNVKDNGHRGKDNVEVPVVFEEANENDVHDSTNNDDDGDVIDKKSHKNLSSEVSENIVSEQNETAEEEEEEIMYSDDDAGNEEALNLSTNYDESHEPAYTDPHNNDDNDPQHNDDNDLDEREEFDEDSIDVEDIGTEEHFSDNVDQSYGDFNEQVQNDYSSQSLQESAEEQEHDDSVEEGSSQTTTESHPQPGSVCDDES